MSNTHSLASDDPQHNSQEQAVPQNSASATAQLNVLNWSVAVSPLNQHAAAAAAAAH
jgi:hypothetical protein